MTPPDSGEEAPLARDPVEELAETFLERYRRGERPSLSEFIARAPEHAQEIRELFPALVLMEQADPAASAHRPAAACHLERLGDYRLIREVGRGGMGIVYEAEQESLGRHVALKILPLSAATDGKGLIRFRREARSAARLHHTNIVPVFDIGEREGIHYYAMQFIEGQGLDQVIAELRLLRRAPMPPAEGVVSQPAAASAACLAESVLSGRFGGDDLAPEGMSPSGEPSPPATWQAAPDTKGPRDSTSSVGTDRSDLSGKSDLHFYRSVARVGLQAAEALAYAHGQRVLHRDIKPSNLLLDTAGAVWVTDFGLAKEEGDNLTRTGDIVGTLRYLAPERLSGMSDPRSDVYSLGLTLYELLTQRPAFAETERVRLIRAITHQEPPALRKLDPHVPRDLETIILKAMVKEPAGRYASAAELAEDLRRFLEDRPIQARRSTWVEQGWRWCRRNPLPASLATTVFLAALVIVGSLGWVIRDQQTRAAVTAGQVEQALRDVEAHYQRGDLYEAAVVARKAQELLDFGGGDAELQSAVRGWLTDLEMVAGLEKIRFQWYTADSAFVADYGQAFRDYGLDLETLPAAEAAARIANRPIRFDLVLALDVWASHLRWAPSEHPRAMKLLAIARAADPDPQRNQLRDAVTRKHVEFEKLVATADISTMPLVTLELLATFTEWPNVEEQIAFLRKLQRQYPSNYRFNLALGGHCASTNPPQWDESLRFASVAVAVRPHSSLAHHNLGFSLMKKGLLDDAQKAFQEAIRLEPEYAVAHYNLGILLTRKGLTDEAIAAYREAVRLQPNYASARLELGDSLSKKGLGDEALAEFREAARTEPDYAKVHYNLGYALQAKGLLDDAIASYREAIRLNPNYPSAYNNLGLALSTKGLFDDATAAYREAIRANPGSFAPRQNLGRMLYKKGLFDEAIAEYHEAVRLSQNHVTAHWGLAEALDKIGRPDERITVYRRLIQLNPKDVSAHTNLGIALTDQGLHDEAIAAYREAIRLDPKRVAPHLNLGLNLVNRGMLDEAIPSYRNALRLKPDNAQGQLMLNGIAWQLATGADAESWNPARALELAQELVQVGPKAAGHWQTLGAAHYRLDQWQEAVRWLEQACDLGSPTDPPSFFLAMAYWKSGQPDEARKSYESAVQWMERENPEDEDLRRWRTEAEQVLGISKLE